MKCYLDLADEVVVVDGTLWEYDRVEKGDLYTTLYYEWPQQFNWPFIGEQFTRGYQACTGDWVIHADLDMVFHQRDFGKIKQALKDYPSAPAVSFYKWQFIQPDRYNLKSRLLLAVNKGAYGDRITFTGGGDLCQPQLDGKDLDINEMPQAGVPFYNYEALMKTEEQIRDDVGRMDRAYHRHFNEWLYSSDGSDESACAGWLRMQLGRYNKPQAKIALTDHPKYVQETIKNLKPSMWGYNGFNQLEGGYHS